MAQIVTTKSGYPTIILDTLDKIVTANMYVNNGTVTTMKDSNTGANYQVPVARKLIISSFTVVFAGSTNSEVRLWNSASTNSNTGTQMIFDCNQNTASDGQTNVTFPLYAEIAANQYINIEETSGGRLWGSFSGVETNA